MSGFETPLESIERCFQGVIPSWIATCSADGVPNITTLSIVHYVDSERIGLSRQFFNKTSANLDANPRAQVLVIDPSTLDQYTLDVEFLRRETEGATFDRVKANLDAVASQSGLTGVFRLRAVDVHRVIECAPFGDRVGAGESGAEPSPLAALDEFARRLAECTDYDDATRVALEALEDLFDFRQAILLAADERGDRLFAVASNGYPGSSAGAEVPFGVGVIGIAAERRTVVCIPSVARGRAMRAALEHSLELAGADAPGTEIPLPGLASVQSVAGIPLVARGELSGVLYVESEQQGRFGPGQERLLRVIGGQLAGALAGLEQDRREGAAAPSPTPSPAGTAIAVVYYQADDSVFVDGEYLIKGVPGRIFWKLVNEHAGTGRTAFTNRELRLDERLGLPPGNDNLEARLVVLRKRLASAERGIGLERVARGRLELRLERPLELSEVATSGPMRAAHRTSGE